MGLSIASTVLFGGLAFWWGIRMGRWLVRRGATANDLFRGRNWLSVAFLGVYIVLLLVALNAPQWSWLPLEWRVSGMRVTWLTMRVLLLGACGVGIGVSWYTLRSQVVMVALVGLLGVSGFTAAESYLLAPIYPSLNDQLNPNGVYQQTSSSSCAAAAMATVLQSWKIDAPESVVARFAGTSRLGTSMPQLIVAARALGMDGLEVTNATWEQLEQINRPGVLASWLLNQFGRKSPHAIALLALKNNITTIADPAWGKLYDLSPDRLARIWRHTYVPLFRPEEINLSPATVQTYLTRLGYLSSEQPDVTAALQAFQQHWQLKPTGQLNPLTALFLSGPFLGDQVPSLANNGGRLEPG